MRLLVLLFAAAAATPKPAPTCKAQVTTLKTWLARVSADRDRGAYLIDHVKGLVPMSLAKGPVPRMAAMTLVVTKRGARDGNGPLAPFARMQALIHSNRSVRWQQTMPRSIKKGVLVAAQADAPAGAVRDALRAARAEHERAWLVFRPAKRRSEAPAPSALGRKLAAVPPGKVAPVVAVIRQELGPCGGLMDMMGSLAGFTTVTRFKTMLDQPAQAVAACGCNTSASEVTTILWYIAFRDLGVLVRVPRRVIDRLPWGDPKRPWSAVAPAVVAALRK